MLPQLPLLDIFIFIFIFIFIVNAFSKPWILQVLPGQTSLHRVKTIRRTGKPSVFDAETNGFGCCVF